METLILGIESSCDETAAAVVKDGKKLLSNIVSSQIDIHNIFGGVVPEIASRKHTETIIEVVNRSLNEASSSLDDIKAIAVTEGPGLIGSLLIGISTAKTLCFALDKPLVGVNHLEAHISAIHLQDEISFPFVALIVSGGHTNLYLVNDYLDFRLLGNTRDDAAGEAFDKAAKVLGLGYPGGVEIDRRAKNGDPTAISFPRPLKDKSSDFSFSGLKTSLINFVNNNGVDSDNELNDICASFQEAIVETLIEKTLAAAKKHKVKNVLIAGGVACNSRLRQLSKERIDASGIKVYIPAPFLCTDNAAMIASLGYYRFNNSELSKLDLTPYSTNKARN